MRPLPRLVVPVRAHGGLEVVAGLPQVQQRDVVVGDLAAHHPAPQRARPPLPLLALDRPRRQRHPAAVVRPRDHDRAPPRQQVVAVQPVGPPQRRRRHVVAQAERRDGVVWELEEVERVFLRW